MYGKKSIHIQVLSVVVICLFLIILLPSLTFAREGQFQINCPYWYFDIDRAGYVDYTWWHPSERHDYGIKQHFFCKFFFLLN